METLPYHIPALFSETLEALNINPSGTYIDATFGGGGHSRGILSHLDTKGHLYGFDRDLDAMQNVPEDERFTFVHSDFRYMPNFLKYYHSEEVDGIVADLGVSSHHFDDAERGFTFRDPDAPLDMRMNREGGKSAADILNEYDVDQLTSILKNYGELKKARLMAQAICKTREQSPLKTTGDLQKVVAPFIDPRKEKKELAQVFQALRIEVNGELDSLKALLKNAGEVLKPGGRLAIITYHSLEDRLVKNFLRSGNAEGKIEKDFFGQVQTPWTIPGRQPITPTPEEEERNPRARSAKLRVGIWNGKTNLT